MKASQHSIKFFLSILLLSISLFSCSKKTILTGELKVVFDHPVGNPEISIYAQVGDEIQSIYDTTAQDVISEGEVVITLNMGNYVVVPLSYAESGRRYQSTYVQVRPDFTTLVLYNENGYGTVKY